MKILVTCENGCGSSLIVEMKIKQLLDEHGIKADVEHCDFATAKSTVADVYIGDAALINQLEYEDKMMVALDNILSDEEITEKLIEKL